MIINIRGTSGSGKSTLVRAVMSYYREKEPIFIEKRKQPIRYVLKNPNRTPLEVLGHYETACGGCDTIKTMDQIFDMALAANARGNHVLFEGLLICSDVKRTMAMAQFAPFISISLTTPVEQCCDNVRTRRLAGGNTKEFNEKNTRTRYDYEQKQIKKLQDAGVDIRTLVYADALELIKEEFTCM